MQKRDIYYRELLFLCFFVYALSEKFFKIFVKKFFYVKSMSYLCTVINQ